MYLVLWFSYCCMIRYVMCTRVLGLGFIDSNHSMTKDNVYQTLLVYIASYVASCCILLFV